MEQTNTTKVVVKHPWAIWIIIQALKNIDCKKRTEESFLIRCVRYYTEHYASLIIKILIHRFSVCVNSRQKGTWDTSWSRKAADFSKACVPSGKRSMGKVAFIPIALELLKGQATHLVKQILNNCGGCWQNWQRSKFQIQFNNRKIKPRTTSVYPANWGSGSAFSSSDLVGRPFKETGRREPWVEDSLENNHRKICCRILLRCHSEIGEHKKRKRIVFRIV